MPHPFLSHADFGARDCGGCLLANVRGGQAEITCNECGVMLRIVALADLQRTLGEMELSLEASSVTRQLASRGVGLRCSEVCPHCGKVNVFSGFSEMKAYTGQECGRAAETGES